jgi:hypothetical protein
MKRSLCLLLSALSSWHSLLVDSLCAHNPNLELRNVATVRSRGGQVIKLFSSSSSSNSHEQDNTKTLQTLLHINEKQDESVSHGSASSPTLLSRRFSSSLLSTECSCYSARQARILVPLGLAFGSLLASPFATQATPTSATESPLLTKAITSSFLPTIQRFFPQSLPTSAVRRLVRRALRRRQYNPSNTLLATSICPDEINSKPHVSLSSALQEDLLGKDSTTGIFALGGLAGLPFAGISGLQALFSHVPRHVVIFLAPHIGISQNGRVGLIERGGAGTATGGTATASHLSTACGAAIGAGRQLFQECRDQHDSLEHPCLPTPPTGVSFLDYEEDYILDQLRPSIETMLGEGLSEDERNALITSYMYTISLTMFLKELEACWQRGGCPDHVEEITLLSGIIVNQGEVVTEQQSRRGQRQTHHHAEDYFQPRLFQTWTRPQDGWNAASSSSSSSSSLITPPQPLENLLATTFGNVKMNFMNSVTRNINKACYVSLPGTRVLF